MRLICPNCGAQYEVEDNVIPDDGRDVQCSNCGHTWFQRPAHMDAELAEELDQPHEEAAPEAEADRPPPAEKPKPGLEPRGLDPDVADVLREEAAREVAARRGETASLETQQELGLDDPGQAASRSAAARARMARLRGVDEGSPEAAAAAALAAATGSRSDLLPDIEEINSSLTASQDRVEVDDDDAREEDPVPVHDPKRGGFRRGFVLMLLLAVVAVTAYLLAPQIVIAVPQAEPYMAAYVSFVNDLRIQVAEGIDAGLVRFWDLVGGAEAG